MLVHRRRRWTNIKPALGQCFVFTGKPISLKGIDPVIVKVWANISDVDLVLKQYVSQISLLPCFYACSHGEDCLEPAGYYAANSQQIITMIMNSYLPFSCLYCILPETHFITITLNFILSLLKSNLYLTKKTNKKNDVKLWYHRYITFITMSLLFHF